MWFGIQRELKYLLKNKWDLALVTFVPLLLIVMFSAMFAQGLPKHLPIGIIDQDQSNLSHKIENYLSLNDTIRIVTISPSQEEVEHLLNKNEIWGYIHIPAGAEQRLTRGQDSEINMAYNQSYYSIGDMLSSAMLTSTLQATANYLGTEFFVNDIPHFNIPTPNIKMSLLFNPNFNYEFYLEPYVIPAIFHLLLACCVAFSVGQEFKQRKAQEWISEQSLCSAILSKNIVYVAIFSVWTWIWMFWLVDIRGWFVAGHLWIILLAQILFYLAYALISTFLVLITKKSLEVFGVLAVYGGSSLSFAGVTLPVTENASWFTKLWSNIIPYTHYARLQTQQWVIGSPVKTSIEPLFALVIFCAVSFIIAFILLKRFSQGQKS